MYDYIMEKYTKAKSKKQIAYEYVRNLILDGTYGSGQRIVIDQVAKVLGLSPIPVREAIRQLESDGLIEYKPYSGAVVTSINEQEYIETLTVLAILDSYAAALSAIHLTDKDLENLMKLNQEMEAAVQDYEFELFSDLNRKFHAYIYEKSGNAVLMEEIKQAQNRMNRVRRSIFTMVPKRALQSIKEHEQLILLFKEKAPFEKIESHVRQHRLNTISAFNHRNDQQQEKRS